MFAIETREPVGQKKQPWPLKADGDLSAVLVGPLAPRLRYERCLQKVFTSSLKLRAGFYIFLC